MQNFKKILLVSVAVEACYSLKPEFFYLLIYGIFFQI